MWALGVIELKRSFAVFEAACALKGQVERVVYASSAAVHGPSGLRYCRRPTSVNALPW